MTTSIIRHYPQSPALTWSPKLSEKLFCNLYLVSWLPACRFKVHRWVWVSDRSVDYLVCFHITVPRQVNLSPDSQINPRLGLCRLATGQRGSYHKSPFDQDWPVRTFLPRVLTQCAEQVQLSGGFVDPAGSPWPEEHWSCSTAEWGDRVQEHRSLHREPCIPAAAAGAGGARAGEWTLARTMLAIVPHVNEYEPGITKGAAQSTKRPGFLMKRWTQHTS